MPGVMKIGKKLILLSLLIPLMCIGQSFLPKSKGEIVSHVYYTLSYDENHEQAEWVHYYLDKTRISGNVERTNNFRVDNKVKTGSATLADYKGFGYDRGHLAPAGDMKKDRISMSQSFLMSNIAPQNASFNRGGWKKLENLVRGWINNNALYITTAGVLENDLKTIGFNRVSVPNRFYKIIYNPKDQQMIAFLMPNEKITLPLISYVVTVDMIETLTGIDFYSEMEDDLEEKLESEKTIKGWDFNPKLTSFSKAIKSNSVSVQCSGTAKSTGNQCRNKTKNENGYCYAHQKQSPDYKAPPKTNYVGRCNATTKKGTRCKRNASSGSRFCWQH
jgi:endonuclease G